MGLHKDILSQKNKNDYNDGGAGGGGGGSSSCGGSGGGSCNGSGYIMVEAMVTNCGYRGSEDCGCVGGGNDSSEVGDNEEHLCSL